MRAKAGTALLLLLPLAMFLPHLGDFAYPFQSRYSDLTISHFPNLIYLKRSLQTWGEIPLWSNAILSGYPFAADPLSGLWYPPGWLLLALPEPLGFNVLILLHLWGAGLGMAAFLRNQSYSWLAAAAGGLMFELAPKLLAHYAAGHVTLIFSVAWTPWLLLAEQRRLVSWASKGRATAAGLVYALILLADVRWAAYAGVLWFFCSLFTAGSEGQWLRQFPSETEGIFSRNGALAQMGRWLAGFSLQMVLACLIAAPLLLPLAQFVRYTTRQHLLPAENLTLSLSPAHLLGLLIPDMAGYAERMLYPGALAVLMMLWVGLQKRAGEKIWLWVGVIVMALLWSLGSSIPPLAYLTRLPGFNLLRVPSRALLLASLAFSLIGAHGIQSLMDWKPLNRSARWSDPTWALVTLTAFLLMLTSGLYWISSSLSIEFAWGAAAATVFTLIILLRKTNRISAERWGLLLLPLLVLDLGGVGLSQFEFKTAAAVLSQKGLVARYLDFEKPPFRVYSPSYSLPQEIAAVHGIALADGINPLQLSAYVSFMEKASGVPAEGYSVTLPPFVTGQPEVDNRAYNPDASLLGLLNVRYVVTEFAIAADGLILAAQMGTTRIYRNLKALPVAWVQDPAGRPSEKVRPAAGMSRTANTIDVKATGPGLLVLSEIDYPGWRVWVDGIEQPVQRVDGLLRGVLLSEGEHQVRFVFHPALVYAGMFLSGSTCLGLLFLKLASRNRMTV